MQHIIIYIILALAVGYAVKRIHQAFLHTDDICKGCTGCSKKEELLKNYNRKGEKPTCYTKK
ncbi:MAG: FeoB-associated Cys-rich membrane protein [Prevotella sp.]|nr:FeoB-associated Cys-rich membrane protein [Prevotella sp.]